MRQLKLYLDTSILNFTLGGAEPPRVAATQTLLRQLQAHIFSGYISAVVVQEVLAAPEPKRSDLIRIIETHRLSVLELDAAAEALAHQYVVHRVVPKRYDNDARHIAIAVVNNLDVIVSWNFRHMVNVKARLAVNGINRLEGYHEIEIVTPEEVIERG